MRPSEAQLRHEADSLGIGTHFQDAVCLSVCLPCWEDRREGGEEGKKLNVIISLAFALRIGSL